MKNQKIEINIRCVESKKECYYPFYIVFIQSYLYYAVEKQIGIKLVIHEILI